jgi:hypothetical protein
MMLINGIQPSVAAVNFIKTSLTFSMITLMKNKQIIVGGIAVLLVLLLLMAVFIGGKGSGTNTPIHLDDYSHVIVLAVLLVLLHDTK